jgi:hypothetical protein
MSVRFVPHPVWNVASRALRGSEIGSDSGLGVLLHADGNLVRMQSLNHAADERPEFVQLSRK